MNNIAIIEHPSLVRAVSARELHEFLKIETPFHIWIERMLDYGFESELDYVLNKNVQNSNSLGGRPSKDYFLSIETAKEISMLQRTEKGKEARKYFIECERKLKEKSLSIPDFTNPYEAALAWAEAYKQNEIIKLERDQAIKTKSQINNRITATAMARASVETRRANKLADELGVGKNFKQARVIDWLPDYFDVSIVSFYSQLGKTLNNFSKNNGFEVRIVEDSRYGKVKAFHINAILAFKKEIDRNINLLFKYRFVDKC